MMTSTATKGDSSSPLQFNPTRAAPVVMGERTSPSTLTAANKKKKTQEERRTSIKNHARDDDDDHHHHHGATRSYDTTPSTAARPAAGMIHYHHHHDYPRDAGQEQEGLSLLSPRTAYNNPVPNHRSLKEPPMFTTFQQEALLGNRATAENLPDTSSALLSRKISGRDPTEESGEVGRLSWRGTVECFKDPSTLFFDMLNDKKEQESFYHLVQHSHEEAHQLPQMLISGGVAGQRRNDTIDHHATTTFGSRTTRSLQSRFLMSSPSLRPHQQTNDAPTYQPLYTNDELERLHFLKEELRRLEIQRRARLSSLRFLDHHTHMVRHDHAPRHDLSRSSQYTNIALDDDRGGATTRVIVNNHCAMGIPSFRSDSEVYLNSEDEGNFIVSVAPGPRMSSTKNLAEPSLSRESKPSLVPFLLLDSTINEDLSRGDSSAAEDSARARTTTTTTTEQTSLEDTRQGHSPGKTKEDAFQEQKDDDEDATMGGSIISTLMQQYKSVHRGGLEMAPFPLKLHAVLANTRYHHIICWLPDGKSWKVIDPFLLERFVMSRYFGHNKYTSFMRQVNGWGFARRSCRRGPEKGKSYFHIDFVRDDPERCLSMLRRRRGRAKKEVEQQPTTTF